MVLLGLLSVVTFYRAEMARDDLLGCIVKTTSQQNDVLAGGRKANGIEQRADRRLISDALDGRLQTKHDVEKAKERYASAKDRASAVRARTPLPPDPEKECA